MMSINFEPSILVSNVFDPISKTSSDLNKLYPQLATSKRYASVETRVSNDENHINQFNALIKENKWKVTLWATGDITRAGLNPSSTDEILRVKTVDAMKGMIDQAIKNNATYFGIASGPATAGASFDASLDQFEKTVRELFAYIDACKKQTELNIIIEPLDADSHKKNVLGTTETVLRFLQRFDQAWIEDGRLSICWDSAHFALNEENFRESIHALAPYISRVHFANAVLDSNHSEYGDWHMKFVAPGFMNQEVANGILQALQDAPNHQKNVLVACEIRTKQEDDLWAIEEECYDFVRKAVRAIKE